VVLALPFSLLGIVLGWRPYRGLDETRLRRSFWSLLAL
jgi:hypothetical protein